MKNINYLQIKLLLPLIIFILYGYHFISNTTIDTNVKCGKKSEIINGWIKLNISQNILIKKLGIPEFKGEDEYWGATGLYVQEWIYRKKGLSFLMASEKKGGLKKACGITVEEPCQYKTSCNIGIKSSYKDVMLKYKNIIDKENTCDSIIVVGSVYYGTYFYFKNLLVYQIIIGSMAE